MPEASDRTNVATTTGVCAAPSTALYLRPDGYVAACCGGWHLLGRVTGPERRSLREIWSGEEARLLREAVADGDYGLGCWECGQLAAVGRRADSLAADFDRYGPGTPSGFPAMIDFAMSNRCNLQCVMCNGGLSSAIRRHREHREPMPDAYDDHFFDELQEFLPHLVRAQFKGGEPFLARENRRVWDDLLALGASPEVCVTTNGTVWNDRVERYVEDLAMEVILSVDAVDPAVLERIRVGVQADRLWDNVERFRAVTARTGASLTLCLCLMADNWAELAPFLREAERREVGASVIWVDGPAGFNLLASPLPQLVEAAHRMRAQDATVRDLDPTLRSLWDDARNRIESAVEDRSRLADDAAATPVPSPRRSGGDTLVERYRATLAQQADPASPDLLELQYDQDVIRTVSVPAWAQWLRPEDWVGTGLEQTMTVIATAAGTTMRSEVESLEAGVHRAHLTLGIEHPTRLDAVLVPAEPGSTRSHLLVARLDGPDRSDRRSA